MLWGKEVGSLFWEERRKRAVFSYHPDFLKGGLDIAPLSATTRRPSSPSTVRQVRYAADRSCCQRASPTIF